MPGKKNFPFLGPVALCCRVEHVLAHGVELSTLLPTAGRESTLTLSGGDVCALAANGFRPRLTSRDFFDPFEGVVRGGPVDHLYPVHLLSFCGAGPSTRRKTSRRRMAALRDWESAIASNAATRTVPRFRPALPFRGNRISVVSLEEAQGLRPLQFTRRRLDPLAWCLGGLLWDFRRRDQTGFWRVSKQLFAFSREVHGV